jgi:GT2 family glycosyltransferase
MNTLEIENEDKSFLEKIKREFFINERLYYIKDITNIYKCRFLMKFLFFFSLIIQKSGTKNFLKIKFVNEFNSFIKLCKDSVLNKENNYSSFKNPKISVIMPIYNGGRYLKNSLVSIEIQNFKEIEIILIDDCSTDNSITIIEEYMKRDPRIRLIKNIKNRKILYSKFFFIVK